MSDMYKRFGLRPETLFFRKTEDHYVTFTDDAALRENEEAI